MSPHSAHSHTHGQHCPWCEQSQIRFTTRSSHCMRQSTVSNRCAPPGNPAMDKNHKTSADEAALYHTVAHAHPTALYPAPYAPSPRRTKPSSTSKCGHSKTTVHTNTTNTHRKSRQTNCVSQTVQVPLHGPRTSKGEQNNRHSSYRQANMFTNHIHGQCNYPSPSVPTTISSQISSKSSNACPQ